MYLWPFPYFAYFCDISSLYLNMYLMSWLLTHILKNLVGVIKPNHFSTIAELRNRTVITATLLFLKQ